jgi:hypothetical protein
MSTTMANPTCEWVRARLPLWVGDGDDLTEPGDEGGDLSAGDRCSIDRHLGACPSCREHQVALEHALGALASAAAVPPVPPETPALWPALEQRIEAHDARTEARWSPAVRGVVEGGLRAWVDLDDNRPLRSAWRRDSLREALELAGWCGGWVCRGAWLGDHPSEPVAGREGSVRESHRRPGWVVGLSAAAAILAVLIGIPAAHRQAADAESTILANAAPREGWVIPPVQSEPELPVTANPSSDRDLPARQLAQAEPISVPEPPAAGSDGTSGSKATAPTRFGYDLEHGIPMPPDGREAKPVY